MKVLKIKEHKDGSADMTFELNSKDEAILRGLAKKQKKRYTPSFVKKYILSALMEGINDENHANRTERARGCLEPAGEL